MREIIHVLFISPLDCLVLFVEKQLGKNGGNGEGKWGTQGQEAKKKTASLVHSTQKNQLHVYLLHNVHNNV